MKRILTLAFAIMMAVTVMAADKATVYFKVSPEMSCQNCENRIKTNLRYQKGVKEISTCLCDQIVTVSYDPAKTTPEKIAAAFQKIGYTATTTSAPKHNGNCANGHKDCKHNSKECDGHHNNGHGDCAKAKPACDGKGHRHNCPSKK